MHRTFSWFEAVDRASPDDHDARLIFLWIALNALYGRWNDAKGEPEPDFHQLQQMVKTVLNLDRDERVSKELIGHKRLVLSIFEDKFLNEYYWRTLNRNINYSVNYSRSKALELYAGRSWQRLLEEVLQRVYLVRCQLVHGAATYGGRLNRAAVRRSGTLLEHLLKCFLVVIIDHGLSANWDCLCYPPIYATDAAGGVSRRPR